MNESDIGGNQMFDDRELDTLYRIFEGMNNCYVYILHDSEVQTPALFFDATAENIAALIYIYKDNTIGLKITDTIDREMMKIRFEPSNLQHPVQITYGPRWQNRTNFQNEIMTHFQMLSVGAALVHDFPVVARSVFEEYCNITERAAEYAEYYSEK